MKKFKAIRDSYGEKYYHKGDIHEFPEAPSRHFEEVKEGKDQLEDVAAPEAEQELKGFEDFSKKEDPEETTVKELKETEFEESTSLHWGEVVDPIIEAPESEQMTTKELREAILAVNPGENLKGLKKDELIDILNSLQGTGGKEEGADE
jgi:hypothetical protein